MKRILLPLFVSAILVILTACGNGMTTPDLESPPTVLPATVTTSPTFQKQETTEITITLTGKIRTPTITPTPSITPRPDYPKLVPVEFRHYIGLIVPPYPEEVLHGGGGKMGGYSSTGYDNPSFGFAHVRIDEFYTLWFEMFSYRDQKKRAYWEVLDILILPELRRDEVYNHDGCLLNGEYDGEILVIGLLDQEAFRTRYITNDKVRMAWRANREKQVFELISTEGIECHAEMAFTDQQP